jgi:hypothetical protein
MSQFRANREKNRETHAFERFWIAGCIKKPRVINIFPESSLSGGTGRIFAVAGNQNRGIDNIQGISDQYRTAFDPRTRGFHPAKSD